MCIVMCVEWGGDGGFRSDVCDCDVFNCLYFL